MRIHTIIFGTLFCALSLALGAAFFIAQQQWVDFSVLEHYDPGTPTIVLDDMGNEWARFQLDRRDPIALNTVPQHLIHAFLATEDHIFFEHSGISWRGIARSLITNLRKGRIVQGASTITQQLVKLLFFSHERSYSRKIKEALLTIIVEHQFTKEQILETYLNHICFGAGIYGVQAAAQRFWNKSAEALSIAQCATLAGIIRHPNNYCPLYSRNHERSLNRRNLVLKLMYQQNYLSEPDYTTACEEPLIGEIIAPNHLGPHAQEMIRQFLEDLIGKHQLYSAGLTIKTTLNKHAQEQAELAFEKHIAKTREQAPQLDGALVALETETAAIKALVGGYSFGESQFNRAIQAQRQMGSIFKPLVYAAGLEQGKHFALTEVDEPLTQVKNWNPRNVNRRFNGTMTLARALGTSNNIIAIKVLLDVGVEKVIELAQRCHLPGPFPPYPSLALGCTECSALQAGAEFNTLVNKGIYNKPYLIEWVKDKWGKKIWKHRPDPERVLTWNISSQMIQALKLVTHSLKRRMPNWWIKGECVGKTGTTNDARSCWFVGATPHYTTTIYLGCDDNSSMTGNVYSVRHAVPLWLEFNRNIQQKSSTFVHDPQLQKRIIHARTGEPLANTQDPQAITILIDPNQVD